MRKLFQLCLALSFLVTMPNAEGRTCQDDGYPQGYYWSDDAQQCLPPSGTVDWSDPVHIGGEEHLWVLSQSTNNDVLKIGSYSSRLVYNAPDLQKAVDDAGTSAIFGYGFDNSKTIIADHRRQGFEILKDLDIGDKAELSDKTITLKSKYFGFHTDKNIIRNDGVDIIDIADGDIVMYTSMNDEDPTKIIITFWK